MSDAALVIMIMSGPDDGQKIYLSQEHGDGQVDAEGDWSLAFGRREECDVSIPFDTQVSRHHATLRIAQDGTLWLADAASLNGTYLGNARIGQPALLERGQLFRLGRTWMRVQPQTGEG